MRDTEPCHEAELDLMRKEFTALGGVLETSDQELQAMSQHQQDSYHLNLERLLDVLKKRREMGL